jgi:hypothetical protein
MIFQDLLMKKAATLCRMAAISSGANLEFVSGIIPHSGQKAYLYQMSVCSSLPAAKLRHDPQD